MHWGIHYRIAPKTNIQNYIAIFSEEDPLYRTHNSEIGNIMFLACDHVTARYFLIQPCKSGDGFDDHYPTNTHSVNFCGNGCDLAESSNSVTTMKFWKN